MYIKHRHFINEEIHLVRFFIESDKSNPLSLNDCYFLLKDNIIKVDEIQYDVINLIVTKEITYNSSQHGYAGQSNILGSASVEYVGCNRYPDYFVVDEYNDLLDSSWDVVYMNVSPPKRFIYLESKYVINFLNDHINIFKEIKYDLVKEIEKRISHQKLAIFK